MRDQSIHQHLLWAGFKVHMAKTAREAREGAESFQPHVVLLGLDLPDGDGLLVARWIRETLAAPHICVIVMTARCDWQAKRDALEAGVDDFAELPAGLSSLGRTLARNIMRTGNARPAPRAE